MLFFLITATKNCSVAATRQRYHSAVFRGHWELLHVGILNWNGLFTSDAKRRRMTTCRLDLVVPLYDLRNGESLWQFPC